MAVKKSTATTRTAPAKRTVAQPATPVEKGSPLAKRAKRQGYDLPEVPADTVLEEQQPKLVTADKGSPLAKRAKRQGYDLPESPETVITDATVSVPFGGNRNT